MTIEQKTTPPPQKKKEQATIWKIINDHRAQNHSPLPPPKKERKTKEKVVKIQGLSHCRQFYCCYYHCYECTCSCTKKVPLKFLMVFPVKFLQTINFHPFEIKRTLHISEYNPQKRIQTAFIASAAVSNCTVPKPLDLLSESKLISARITLPAKQSWS